MFTEKREFIMYVVGLVILLIVGIGIGYYLWGVERGEKPDYTAYLSKTIDYIKSM
jgi:uncharacterized membrane protein